INEEITYLKFKEVLRDIISKNHKEIKFWNMSINFDVQATKFEVSDYAVFLDGLQEEFKIMFIISTGNNTDGGDDKISPPSDSFRALSVSAVKQDLSRTSYTKKGSIGFHASKPDVSIFGGDINDRISVVSNNKIVETTGGSSYATPLITRLVANLTNMQYSLLEIPAILSSYSSWVAQKRCLKDIAYYPTGALPIDNTELFNMINKKLMWVSTTSVGGGYRHGFYNLEFPLFEEGYDFKFILSYNVDAKFAKNSTFEYVLDSTKVVMGRENPFKKNNINSTDSTWLLSEGVGNEELSKFLFLTEASQRIFKGKYKNRNTLISWPKRIRSSSKTQRPKNQEVKTLPIKKWGLSFVRDVIDTTINRKEMRDQEIAIAFIGESANYDFYDSFVNLNHDIVEKINISSDVKNVVSDEIIFE
ncbi:S8 family serine peptidase, partial [Mycoplasma marinum]|uniref:S8 family serine peptidase n=1 Tax=Mycoplasma marinum TaxID=1937190 RepID=UPI0014445F95